MAKSSSRKKPAAKKKTAAKKVAAKKSSAKKPAAKKTVSKKAAAKKAPAKKTSAKKAPAKKTTAKKVTTKKTTSKKAPAKKAPAKKSAAKKAATKKTVTKKAAAKKAAVKKSPSKKATMKKTAAKKTAAKKAAVKKKLVNKAPAKKKLPKTPYKAAFLKKQKQLLLDAKDKVLESMQGVQRDQLRQHDSGAEASGLGDHLADAGNDSTEHDFALSILTKEQGDLKELDDALKRIENKSYGVCEGSGETIPQARLEFIPSARYTVQFQEQLEERGAISKPRLGRSARVAGAEEGAFDSLEESVDI